ncbi:MAG: hypothetical protein HYY49_03505 [Ignavibacteriales bacterium]|nr:hypothetical protein [Ignavibacteriales bacterium]
MNRLLLFILLTTILGTTPGLAQEKTVTITGTVVDTYCLITMDMSGKGHKKCAEACAKNGVPLGIQEEKTGTIYLAQSQKDMMYTSPALVKYLEEKVTVEGKVHQKGGMKVIVIESVSAAK